MYFDYPYAVAGATHNTSLSSHATSGAGRIAAFSFQLPEDKTLSTVRLACSGKVGTLNQSDMVVEIRPASGTDFAPDMANILESRNTPVENLNSITSSNPYVSVTGFTTQLSADVHYWVVVRNANSTPGSNYFTIYYNQCPSYYQFSGNGTDGYNAWLSSDNGTTWSRYTHCFPIQLRFADGDALGLLYHASALPVDRISGTSVYVGAYFKTPGNIKLRVTGVGAVLNSSGTPPYCRFYLQRVSDGEVLAYTSIVRYGAPPHYVGVWFNQIVVLQPDTYYRLYLAPVSGSPNMSNWTSLIANPMDSSSINMERTFFQGTLRYCYSTDAGQTWTNVDAIPAFVLTLDHDKPWEI